MDFFYMFGFLMKVVWLNTRLEVFDYKAAAASVDWMLSHMLLPHHLVGISHDKAEEFYTAALLLTSVCNNAPLDKSIILPINFFVWHKAETKTFTSPAGRHWLPHIQQWKWAGSKMCLVFPPQAARWPNQICYGRSGGNHNHNTQTSALLCSSEAVLLVLL